MATKSKNFKNILVKNLLAQFKNKLVQMILGDPIPTLLKLV